VLVGAGTGTWFAAIADDGHLVRANVVASVVALTVLAAGLALRLPVTVPLAIAVLGAEYVAILGFEADALDTQAPLVAGALLAIAELAYWSLELRVALLATLVVGVVGVGAIMLTLVEVIAAGGIAVDILGAAAAFGALGLLALAARRTS
jgi:hypothetical protein